MLFFFMPWYYRNSWVVFEGGFMSEQAQSLFARRIDSFNSFLL